MSERRDSLQMTRPPSLANMNRKIILPSEALKQVEILHLDLDRNLVRLRSKEELDVLAYVHEQDAMDVSVGHNYIMYVTMNAEHFEVIEDYDEDITEYLRSVDDNSCTMGTYEFLGRIEGFYDWHIHRHFNTQNPQLNVYILLQTGHRIAIALEIPLSDSRRIYFGHGDCIRGVGKFFASSTDVTDPRQVVSSPPWCRRGSQDCMNGTGSCRRDDDSQS